MSVAELAENYFGSLNSMATRIYADINDTKSAYDQVWKTLSTEEQAQIVNECIIKPEVMLQYSLKPQETLKVEPIAYAQKRIVDETCTFAFRDEHSGPFSFKTNSQMNLTIFTDNNKDTDSENTLKVDQVRPKIEEPPPTSSPRYKTDNSLFNKLLRRTSSPDAEQEILVSPDTSTTSADTLPKTGLDFLDNW